MAGLLSRGKVYYINNIPSIRYPEYPYYQLKTIYGDTLEFVHADLPLPTETDKAFNRINHGMEEFMVQDIMSAKKNYINFYGIYKERLYRLTAITRYNYSDYSVWNKKSDVGHHFPEEIYGSISYDEKEFALPDHFTGVSYVAESGSLREIAGKTGQLLWSNLNSSCGPGLAVTAKNSNFRNPLPF